MLSFWPHGLNCDENSVSREANENVIEDCGHPKHAILHLKVTAISRCDGFEPVKARSARTPVRVADAFRVDR
jgi:hypothetical protein